jgi:hypothetical protein
MKMFRRIFNTAQNRIVYNIAGYPDNKQISQTLVEDDLRGETGVSTAQDSSERMLSAGYFAAAGGCLVRMHQLRGNVSFITLHELL